MTLDQIQAAAQVERPDRAVVEVVQDETSAGVVVVRWSPLPPQDHPRRRMPCGSIHAGVGVVAGMSQNQFEEWVQVQVARIQQRFQTPEQP